MKVLDAPYHSNFCGSWKSRARIIRVCRVFKKVELSKKPFNMHLVIQLSHGFMVYFAWMPKMSFLISIGYLLQLSVICTMSIAILFSLITKTVNYFCRLALKGRSPIGLQ